MGSLHRPLLLIFAIAQFIVPALPNYLDGLTPIQGVSGNVPPPEQPAGYAFSIWFPIFALITAYAVRQLIPATRNDVLDRRIGWLALGATAANVVWMALAITLGSSWSLVVVIFTIFAFAVAALFRQLSARADWTRFDRWISQPAFALLSAWLTAAVWLNLSSQLRQSGIAVVDAQTPEVIAAMVIAAISVTGLVLAWSTRWNAFYLATLCWAFVAVAVQNVTTLSNPVIAAVAGALGLVTLIGAVRGLSGRSASNNDAAPSAV